MITGYPRVFAIKLINLLWFYGVIGLILAGCTDKTNDNVQVAQKSKPPNIVFILVDDLGWGDLGYLGSEIKTPRIDQLAASGVRLDRNYVFPICSPTRAALLTGMNPIAYGVDGPMEHNAMLTPELKLMPEFLRNGGYETWMVGKWHLGAVKQSSMPHNRGFDHFYGFLGGFIDFYTHVYFGGLDWQRNGESLREKGYATDLLTNEARRLLDGYDGEKPFFMYLSYNSPHTPLQYPPTITESYDDIASTDRQVFAQMTTDVDSAIGEVIDSLEQKGLIENTIVIFMSDNGGNVKAGASNGELRGSKGSVYEGGVRVPGIISWPGVLDAGSLYSNPVFVQDWLPSLLDIADIQFTQDHFEGRSVWSELSANSPIPTPRDGPLILGTNKVKTVLDWPWKLVRVQSGGDELYNVLSDPGEKNNLASEYLDRVSDMGMYIDARPRRESKAGKGPPPESLFRDETGAFDYYIRKPETREPWAESATKD